MMATQKIIDRVKNHPLFIKLVNYAPHFAALVTFSLAVFGGYAGYMSYFLDQPNLIVHIDSYELKGFSDLRKIPEKLSLIEQNYGEVTAGKIIELKAKSAALKKFDSVNVDNVLKDVYKAIAEFQQPIAEWTWDKITYQYGIITWPDSTPGSTQGDTQFDLIRDSHAEYIFADEYLQVRKNPETPGADIINRIKKKAFYLYKPFDEAKGDRRELGDKQEKREGVAKGLREVKHILEESQDKLNYFLELNVKVINKSRQQNLVWEQGYLKIQLSLLDEKIPPIKLRLVDSSILPSIGVHELTFRTDPLGHFDAKLREQILAAYPKNSLLTFTLTDLYHKSWFQRVRFFNEQVAYLTEEENEELGTGDSLKDLK